MNENEYKCKQYKQRLILKNTWQVSQLLFDQEASAYFEAWAMTSRWLSIITDVLAPFDKIFWSATKQPSLILCTSYHLHLLPIFLTFHNTINSVILHSPHVMRVFSEVTYASLSTNESGEEIAFTTHIHEDGSFSTSNSIGEKRKQSLSIKTSELFVQKKQNKTEQNKTTKTKTKTKTKQNKKSKQNKTGILIPFLSGCNVKWNLNQWPPQGIPKTVARPVCRLEACTTTFCEQICKFTWKIGGCCCFI